MLPALLLFAPPSAVDRAPVRADRSAAWAGRVNRLSRTAVGARVERRMANLNV